MTEQTKVFGSLVISLVMILSGLGMLMLSFDSEVSEIVEIAENPVEVPETFTVTEIEPMPTSLQEPIQMLQSGFIQEARQILRQCHEEHPDCALWLGISYFPRPHGYGESFLEAQPFLEDAWNRGNVTAGYYLGVAYFEALGVPKDEKKAIEYMRLPADEGNAIASLYLGHILMYGSNKNGEYAEAIQYLDAATNAGDFRAHYWLGIAYEYGKGTNRDWEKALAEYEKACIPGFAISCSRYSQLAYTLLPSKTDPLEIEELNAKNLTYMHKAKFLNDPDGIVLVALRELDYADQDFSPAEAVKDLLQVCESHKGCYCRDAAMILETGFLIPQDRIKAQTYFEEYGNHECGADSDIHKLKPERDRLFDSKDFTEIHTRALQNNKIAMSEIAAYLRIRSKQDPLLHRWIHRWSLLSSQQD